MAIFYDQFNPFFDPFASYAFYNDFFLKGLQTGVTGTTIYLDENGKFLSGPASPGSGFNPNLPQTITAPWVFANQFTVTSNTLPIYIGNSATPVPLLTNEIGIESQLNLYLIASENSLLSAKKTRVESLDGDLLLYSTTGCKLTGAQHSIDGLLSLKLLTNGTAPHQLFYDPGTGDVSHDVVDVFDVSANYNLTGNWNFNSTNFVVETTENQTFKSTTGGISFESDSFLELLTNGEVNFASSLQMTFTSGSVLSLNGTQCKLSGDVFLETIPVATLTDTNQLFYDPITKKTSHAPAVPANGIKWQALAGDTQVLTKNVGYICQNVASTSFSLPLTADVGDVFGIALSGVAGFTVSQGVGQVVYLDAIPTTVGVAGSLASTNNRQIVEIVCVVANTEFSIINASGNVNLI